MKTKAEKIKKIEEFIVMIKEYRKEQHIVSKKRLEILDIEKELHGHEVMKHYYEVSFVKKLGKNWDFLIRDIEKLGKELKKNK